MEYCVGSASDILEGKLNVLCQLYVHSRLQTCSIKLAIQDLLNQVSDTRENCDLKDESSLCFLSSCSSQETS